MSDIVTGKTFIDGEKGITATKLNQIQSLAVIQPDFYSNKAVSSTLDPTDTFLELKNTGVYAQITGANLISSVGTNLTPSITSVRLRSYNAIQNPGFEVTQRNIGNGTANLPNGGFLEDRWIFGRSTGTTYICSGQSVAATGYPYGIVIPGTNFPITRRIGRLTLNGQQWPLTGNQTLSLTQLVEGPVMRELLGDLHSISILCRTSLAPLTFAVSLRDSIQSVSLVKTVTLSSTNWTLVTFPGLPAFASSGTWPVDPGTVGYYFTICLDSGPTLQAPALGAWVNGNYTSHTSVSSFANVTPGTYFDIAFVQHEPGSQCTTLIDRPWNVAYREAQRYFSKSWNYGIYQGTVGNSLPGVFSYPLAVTSATLNLYGNVTFPARMAKNPTVVTYNNLTGGGGAANLISPSFTGNMAITATTQSETGILAISSGPSSTTTGAAMGTCDWTADTGM